MVKLSSSVLLVSVLASVTNAASGFLNNNICDRNTLSYNNDQTLSVTCKGKVLTIKLSNCIANSNGQLVWRPSKPNFTGCAGCSVRDINLICDTCFKLDGDAVEYNPGVRLNNGIGYVNGKLTCA
ncbi:hypothetical protein DSL72_007307 [Monilinia vaccinii-corymbosi]|uniref:Cyanovirin-N domain-containing protein n=1 Tax=Monilinia vaccinii-corymbosi TaxID=61207 RepID=A0A8A3PLA6_9HELO|nr:hypothetical protein DSL72_007307 [Monilinia vaccinii-corymbosi]